MVRGVLYTEAMQGFVMLVGICMLTVAVFDKVGGPVEGMARLAELAPTATANTGFVSLADGGQGWFIISLVIVTSVAVWAQPQMIQRHFALNSARQVNRITPLAMLVLTVLVGGAYYVASLARLFMPEVASPDDVMPALVKMLLPDIGLQLFVLAFPVHGHGHLPHRRGGHRRRPAGPQDLARHVVRGHRLLCAAQRRLCPDQGTDHRHALHHQLEHRGLHGTGGLCGPGALRQAQQPGRLVQLRCGLRELHALVPHDAPAIRHPAHALAFAGRAAALLRGLCFLAGRLGTRLGPGRRGPPELLVLARGHEARDVILKTRGRAHGVR